MVVPNEPRSTTRVTARDDEELNSDDDDDETLGCLLSAEEVDRRTKVWEELNQEYITQQKDRERMIRLGIVKPRVARKRKAEADTAEQVLLIYWCYL